MRPSLFLAVLHFFLVTAFAQDGIYADFTTSMGSYTCKLHYDRAPKTVANFIALATGDRAWLDLANGAARRTPFYDSLTFHRVVSGFVIQGGSRKGDGTDGPGYTFQDEFEPTLKHNKAGILSMANSGPNSNGSQFFVTLSATPHLDDVHSVFGEVTDGLPVVQAIGNVPVDTNSKPLTPIVMQSVVIRRVGAAAQAFNVSAQGLPSVGGAGPIFARSGASSVLQFPRSIYSEYVLFDSSDLAAWTRVKIGLYVAPPPSSDLDVTSSAVGSSHFYRVAQVAYPGPLFTPPSLFGSTMQLTFTSGTTGTLTLSFNNSGGGTTTAGANTGTITSYTWAQEAYRGQLVCQSTNLFPLVLSHVFTSAGGGSFKGTVFSGNPFPVAGTFTHTVSAPLSAFSSSTIKGRNTSKVRTSSTVSRLKRR
jgi:cyclophilin family peptidyl-prolyl cis-trans isomerase